MGDLLQLHVPQYSAGLYNQIRERGVKLIRDNPNYAELSEALHHEPTRKLLRALFEPAETRTKLTLTRLYLAVHDTLETTTGRLPTDEVVIGIMHAFLTDAQARRASVNMFDVGPIRQVVRDGTTQERIDK